MQVTINPYHRSVTIDGVEVIQKILPFPDDMNSIASVTCVYDPDTHKISEVSNIHRYVNHYIAKEYYYDNLPKFIDWFHAEKAEQEKAQSIQEQETIAVNNAITASNKVVAEARKQLELIQQKIDETTNVLDTLDEKVKDVNDKTLDIVENAILEASGTLPVRLAENFPKRSLIERCRDIVNVKDYGAVANGEDDDTCAFNDATDVAVALHAPLYIPAGLYRLDSLPIVPAYGSGVLLVPDENGELQHHYAMDLLFKPNGGIERDEETGKYKVSEGLTIPVTPIVPPTDPEDPDEPTLIYTSNVLPITQVNTQEILDNNGEYLVPVSGVYSIMLIGAGFGGCIRKSGSTILAQAGRSGTINHFYKHLNKDDRLVVEIGQPGLGYNEFDSESEVTEGDIEGGITYFDIHTSDNYPHRHYHTDKHEVTSFASLAGAGLGGGWYDASSDMVHDGGYYGAGGGVHVDVKNSKYMVSNGHRGAVILLYCNPDK